MRARVSKAKAFVAVKNHAAAIYELEGIKRETNDPIVNGVVQVMLINCYLEQLDYKRAQSLLNEVFNAQKANKPNSNYFAVAGQVVKGAKNQRDRYQSLGLSVADRSLPAEALADLEKMRETVEIVIAHSKTLSENKKLASDSMALLEESSNARSGLARDDYDAKRWKDEVSDARERLTTSRTTIINTVNDGTPNTIDMSKTLATNSAPVIPNAVEPGNQIIPISNESKSSGIEKNIEIPKIPSAETVTKNDPIADPKPKETPKEEVKVKTPDSAQDNISRERKVSDRETTKNEEPKLETSQVADSVAKVLSPMQIGSLIDYATSKVSPTYPPAAKTMRMTGTVKVEILINEDGSIAEVQKTSGPSMLQRAAVDAVRRWKFKPFIKDGQAVKASGFVSFSFSL